MWLIVIAGAALVGLAHTAPFPFLLEALGPGRSIWQAPIQPDRPSVYLTFDDGPNPDATPALLDVLASEGAAATFFLIPEFVTAETAPIVRRAAAEGHDIALHASTRGLLLLPPAEFARWLRDEADRIESVTGVRPCRLFRPHAGWRGGQMYEGLDQAGYLLAGWGFALWDFNWWRRNDPDRLAARLAGRVSDGSIVVMHDGFHKRPRSERRATVEATARLVPRLRQRGLAFGGLCALAR